MATSFPLFFFFSLFLHSTGPVITRCETIDVPIDSVTTDLRLLGCDETSDENLLWNLDRADSLTGMLDEQLQRSATGRGSVVYVYDSGIRSDHQEFVRADGSPVVISGIDPGVALNLPPYHCSTPVTPLVPCRDTTSVGAFWIYTHGTAVASVIAGQNVGVAPDASLVSVQGVRLPTPEAGQYEIDVFDLIIRHAWDPSTPSFRTAIINMSLAFALADHPSAPLIENKMRDMIHGVDADGNRDPDGKRFLFVAIAGNYHRGSSTAKLHGQCNPDRSTAYFPSTRGSAIDGLIVVSGVTRENRVWEGACIGDGVDILAPAAEILVASNLDRDLYRSGYPVFGVPANSGTSYAAPYVSGLAAILLEKNPDLSPEQIEWIIKSRASRVSDPNETTAGGRVAILDVPLGPRRRAVRR